MAHNQKKPCFARLFLIDFVLTLWRSILNGSNTNLYVVNTSRDLCWKQN